MSAGWSSAEVQAARRRALAAAAKRFGGKVVGVYVKFRAQECRWLAYCKLQTASNGEGCLIYVLVNEDTGFKTEAFGTWEHLAIRAGLA